MIIFSYFTSAHTFKAYVYSWEFVLKWELLNNKSKSPHSELFCYKIVYNLYFQMHIRLIYSLENTE